MTFNKTTHCDEDILQYNVSIQTCMFSFDDPPPPHPTAFLTDILLKPASFSLSHVFECTLPAIHHPDSILCNRLEKGKYDQRAVTMVTV